MELQPPIDILNKDLRKSFKGMTEDLEKCINDCLECHRACEQTIPYCLQEEKLLSSRELIQILSNCADICRTSAHFMMWNSTFHKRTCEICSEVCAKCAQECEHFPNDPILKTCAEICRRCFYSCQKMSVQH
ncbi:MAG: four-helix bundle copper-binding protein [Bdellovibrio sp.]